MPTRLDIEAATPKCPVLDRPTRSYAFPVGQHPQTVRCATPMVWVVGHWRCPVHGRQEFCEAA